MASELRLTDFGYFSRCHSVLQSHVEQRSVDTCGGRCNILLLKVTDGFIGGVLMAGICLVGVVSHSSFMLILFCILIYFVEALAM